MELFDLVTTVDERVPADWMRSHYVVSAAREVAEHLGGPDPEDQAATFELLLAEHNGWLWRYASHEGDHAADYLATKEDRVLDEWLAAPRRALECVLGHPARVTRGLVIMG